MPPTEASPPYASAFTPTVVRFGALGDMLLMVPMLKLLAQRFGGPCNVVSSGGWTLPLLDRVPAAGQVKLLSSRRAPYWLNRSQRELVAWLRQLPPGPVYIFEQEEKSHWLVRRAGISDDWICSVQNLPRLPNENIQNHALRMGRETPVALRDIAPAIDPALPMPNGRVALLAADRADVQAWVHARGFAHRPLVLIQPGNKKTMKRGKRDRSSNIKYWPESAWAEVIRGIRTRLPESRVLICGAPSECELGKQIRDAVGGDGVEVVADDLPLPRLFALQEIAHSMVSVDTGPAHGAAALGCPLVVLFSRVDPTLYSPVSTTAPVKVVTPPRLIDPLTHIAPSEVLAAWASLTG